MGGSLIKTVRYADHQAALTTSAEGRQHMIDKMQKPTVEYGMKTNMVMKISKRPGEEFVVLLEGEPWRDTS